MHTLSRYDFTYREVEKRGYKNIFVFMNETEGDNTDIIQIQLEDLANISEIFHQT